MKQMKYIGFCAACARDFKVRGERLVLHGYKRPGYGYILGNCIGARALPHELSPELAQKVLVLALAWQSKAAETLAALEAPTSLTVARGWNKEQEQIELGHPEFERVLRTARYHAQAERDKADGEVRRLSQLIKDWRPKQLTTVLEEQALQREAKEAREAQRAKARAAKLRAKVESLQARVDAAVRNKNGRSLAAIWESAQRSLRDIDPSLSRADALALLKRDYVWAAFGMRGLTLADCGWIGGRPELRVMERADKTSWPKGY